MRGVFSFAAVLGIATVVAAGCGPSNADERSGDWVAPEDCAHQWSCGSCVTLGCTWCVGRSGASCIASYKDCDGTSYSYPNRVEVCPGPALYPPDTGTVDAGAPDASLPDASFGDATDAKAADAASDATSGDAAVTTDSAAIDAPSIAVDASDDSPSDASSADDGGAGCVPNDGAVCGADAPYGLTCTRSDADSAVPTPPSWLSCRIVASPTPSGTLFYCCLHSASSR